MVTTMNMAIPTIKTPPTTDNPSCLRRNTPEAFFPQEKSLRPRKGTKAFRLIRSCFFHEFFPAFGAGDCNLAFPPGNTDSLPTFGAVKITVVSVFDPVEGQKVSAVFLIALVMVSGKAPEQRPAQQSVGTQLKHQHQRRNKQRNQRQHHTCGQNRTVEFIVTIPAAHKTPEPGGGAGARPPKPCGNVLHKDHLVGMDRAIIGRFPDFSTATEDCLRIVSNPPEPPRKKS